MFTEYPYRNIEDLNLDYLLKRIKEVENSIKSIKEDIEGEIFDWVKEQIKPFEDELNDLINEVNDLSEDVSTTLATYDTRITAIQNQVNNFIIEIRQAMLDQAESLSSLMDTKIENNNITLMAQITENVGNLFLVVNPFSGELVTIQSMIDTLSYFHINDGIDYATMNSRALTYNQFNALNITYSDLLLHGNTLYT